jgi:predicted enzyme involved in methoxymalonyl-ACP biosynthesis
MGAADRFGDFGLTGVAIVAPEAECWQIDTFLLSCRVIGKSVESALLARIAADARTAGARALIGEFIHSGRNQVASSFLPSHGFALRDDGCWERALSSPGPDWPDWIEEISEAGGLPDHTEVMVPR